MELALLYKGTEKLLAGWNHSSWMTIIGSTAVGLSLGLTVNKMSKYLRKKSKTHLIPERWIKVGNIKKLLIYPVKSCKGVEVESAELTQLGLKGNSDIFRDRFFLIVDSDGKFQTIRQHPNLVLIEPKIDGNKLTISSPGMEPITILVDPSSEAAQKKSCRIFVDHIDNALDCGDEIGKWIDTFLGVNGYRLLYHCFTSSQRMMTDHYKKFPHFSPNDTGAFHDETSYMLMTEESIEALNKSLTNPVTYESFRPCILLENIPEPFDEDNWSYIKISDKSDGPVLKTAMPCSRCKVTTVNTTTGILSEDGEPLKTAYKLTRKIGDEVTNHLCKRQAILGTHFGLVEGEGKKINVGDPVYVALY